MEKRVIPRRGRQEGTGIVKERRMRILEGRLIVGVIGNCILPRIKLQDGGRESGRPRGIERDDTRFPVLTIIYKLHVFVQRTRVYYFVRR